MYNPNFNKSRFDPKKYYTIFFELGVICSLLIFIVATKIQLQPSTEVDTRTFDKQEIVTVEETIQTEQPERPPAPPVPRVPVAVPNSEIIEDEILSIDADFSYNEPLDIPPPPKEVEMEEKEEEEDFFIAVEQMPKMKGTMADLQQQIQYPEKALQAGVEGRVIVQFIINEKGEVEDPKVIRGIGAGCDEEAIRVTKLAKFEPGRQRGKAVRVRYSLPFMFIVK